MLKLTECKAPVALASGQLQEGLLLLPTGRCHCMDIYGGDIKRVQRAIPCR
jgi:hypothetical protein